MSSPWNDGAIDCPVCGECRAFTIDLNDESRGYCEAEGKTHTVKWDTVECNTCGRETLRSLTVETRNAAFRLVRVCKRCAKQDQHAKDR